jgi:peptide/nickel transport system substrate-binding protein
MPSQYDRRKFLVNGARGAAGIALLGGTGSLLAGCGSSSSTKAKAFVANRGGINTGKPKYGGALVFGTEAEETSFDPTEGHFDSTGVMYARTVYDPLMIVQAPTANSPASFVPYLAQSVTSNPDYTLWTITLRPNLVFHDGTPCDGQALKFCFEQFIESPLVDFTTTYVEKGGIGYSASDPLTVTIKMIAPWCSFPAWLTGYIGGQMAYVFSPTQFLKHTGNVSSLAAHPVGTGPFVFSEWVLNDHFTATRNPHYWRVDKYGNRMPYLDSVTFKPLPNVSARWAGLKTGTLNIMHTDDPETILDIRADASLQDVEDDKLPVEHDMNFLMLNTLKPPLDDIRIRQAIAYAYDQSAYLRDPDLDIDLGSAGPFSPGSAYYAPTGYPKFDVQKGTALVQQYVSEHGGKPITLQIGTTQTPQSVSDTAIVQNYLKAIGITATAQPIEQSELIDDAIFGEFQMLGWRQFANVDPDMNYPFWASAAAKGGISVNFTGLKDAVVQKSIDAGRQTTDTAARIDAYQAVARQFGTQCPYIWSSQDVWSIGAASNVQNFNGPTAPNGQLALGMLSGIVWTTEIWMT